MEKKLSSAGILVDDGHGGAAFQGRHRALRAVSEIGSIASALPALELSLEVSGKAKRWS